MGLGLISLRDFDGWGLLWRDQIKAPLGPGRCHPLRGVWVSGVSRIVPRGRGPSLHPLCCPHLQPSPGSVPRCVCTCLFRVLTCLGWSRGLSDVKWEASWPPRGPSDSSPQVNALCPSWFPSARQVLGHVVSACWDSSAVLAVPTWLAAAAAGWLPQHGSASTLHGQVGSVGHFSNTSAQGSLWTRGGRPVF